MKARIKARMMLKASIWETNQSAKRQRKPGPADEKYGIKELIRHLVWCSFAGRTKGKTYLDNPLQSQVHELTKVLSIKVCGNRMWLFVA